MQVITHLGTNLAEQAAHLSRVGIAHSIGKRDPIGAGIDAGLRKGNHCLFAHLSLDRAPERGRKANVDAHGSVALVAQTPDIRELGNHLRRRSLHVGKAVGLARRNGDDDGLDRGINGRPCAFEIRDERRDRNIRQALGGSDHLRSIGHLRHEPGRHEGCDFEVAHPAGMLGINPGDLVLCRQHAIENLQAIAQADFHDLDFFSSGSAHLGTGSVSRSRSL